MSQRRARRGQLVRARDGDIEAFGEFYDRHAAELLRWFRSRTADSETAADLCSETFTAALDKLDSYDPTRGDETAWLYGIAKNQLRHWLRRHYVDRRARTRAWIDVPPPPDDPFDLVDIRMDLERQVGPLEVAIDRLSEKARTTLRLRFTEQLPYSEIARLLGCREVTARVRVSRALNDLLAHFPDPMPR